MLRKWLTTLFALIIFDRFANAQNINFGLKAGVNFASISAYNNPTSSVYQSKNYTNFRIGAITETDWSKLTLRVGLLLDGKGGENTYINPETNTNRRKDTHLYYLEVPINLLYRVKTKSSTLFFGGGPYASYGLTGTYNLSGIIFDSPVDGSEKVNFGNNENSDYKRTDYGLNFCAKIRLLHGIGFELTYEYGLRNIATPGIYDDANIKTRNKVFGVAVTYLIKKINTSFIDEKFSFD